MKSNILPIGSVIFKDDKKYIIIDYDFGREKYVCAGYPSYFLIDLVPIKKIKEYKSKYNNYNTDDFIGFDDSFEIIFKGYVDTDFEEQVSKLMAN